MLFALFLPSLAIAADGSAVEPRPTVESSLGQQRKSVEAQRQAVRKQAAMVQAAPTDDFFTAPWATPPLIIQVASAADCDPIAEPQVAALVDAAAAREKVRPELVRAVIRQESGFRACAVSPKGAQGLMQLMPATAERFHVADPFDPAQNVDAGTKLLKELLTKYAGDVKLALGAYNAGTVRVDETGAIPDTPETRDYVSNILKDLGADAGGAGKATDDGHGST